MFHTAADYSRTWKAPFSCTSVTNGNVIYCIYLRLWQKWTYKIFSPWLLDSSSVVGIKKKKIKWCTYWVRLVFHLVLQSLKRQNRVREFSFISSCSPIWPHKHQLISNSGNLFVTGTAFSPACFVALAGRNTPAVHDNQKYHQELPLTSQLACCGDTGNRGGRGWDGTSFQWHTV